MNTTDPNRFAKAIARFDEENAQDPNVETIDGKPQPRELVYAKRLTAWVRRLPLAGPRPGLDADSEPT